MVKIQILLDISYENYKCKIYHNGCYNFLVNVGNV